MFKGPTGIQAVGSRPELRLKDNGKGWGAGQVEKGA